MIRVLFFARLREKLQTSQLDVSADVPSVNALIAHLQQAHGAHFADVLNAPNVIVACNHDVVERDHALSDGDEVAFYPPVTGG